MRNLTPQEVTAYSQNSKRLILVAPDKSTIEVWGIWYEGLSLSIQKDFKNINVTIDTSHPDTKVFLEDDAIHILTQNKDEWIVKELDFNYFISNEFQEEEMLEDYQARLCKKRAEELTLYLNHQLDLYDDFGLLVYVSLRADVDYCCDTQEYFSAIVTHNFEIFVTNIDGDIYAGGFILCLDSTNDSALKVLTRELIRHLLPVQDQYKSTEF